MSNCEDVLKKEYQQWLVSSKWSKGNEAGISLMSFQKDKQEMFFKLGDETELFQFGIQYGKDYPNDFKEMKLVREVVM